MTRFAVDLAEPDSMVDALHDAWSGAGADAQTAAHARMWRQTR